MKKAVLISICMAAILTLASCRQATVVSYNISKEADAFNSYRRVTVVDCITNDTLFVVEGWISIQGGYGQNSSSGASELQIIAEVGPGKYQKHLIGLSDNVSYVVEDLGGEGVDRYHFNIYFNPKMWLPGVELTD